MDLSVIIVNYNVKALLEQTLLFVEKAIHDLKTEVIVVDNHSADESCMMVKEKFPNVILIENKENIGFSKANNQGILIAKGRNILLLNPDTVIREDTLTTSVHFLDNHSEAGALGVRMMDGRGKFLPESKRGLPTPMVAFYKMSGLSKLFPNSKTFGAYHLSYLNEFENHEVEILSGAYMMIKKEVLDKVGLLDEDFFMYGEDIDLSYRIIKGGYKNYYLADTSIIHYKGESTKKHSVNYVKIFYQAMAKFARKHFSKQQGWWFSACINLAIFARASMAVLVRFFNNTKLFLLDFILIFIGFYGIMRYWEIYNKYVVGGFYPDEYLQFHVPAYILLWLSGIQISGGYKQPFQLNKTVRGVIIGSMLLLTAYALLPENMRFSRALILLGSVWALLITVFIRLVLHFYKYKHFDTQASQKSQVLIVGDKDECLRVKNILSNYPNRFKLLGFVKPNEHVSGTDWMGSIENIALLVELYKANEIIFCAKNVSSTDIMKYMSYTVDSSIKYKIIPESGTYIIGSNSKNTTGEFYSIDITYAISNKETRKKKRRLDVLICLVSLPFIPLMIFKNSFFKLFISNWLNCLKGDKTWVGYNSSVNNSNLPELKASVFELGRAIDLDIQDKQLIYNLNQMYASHYHWQKDIDIVVKAFFSNKFAN
jgi:GT2 family glycosyltransferase